VRAARCSPDPKKPGRTLQNPVKRTRPVRGFPENIKGMTWSSIWNSTRVTTKKTIARSLRKGDERTHPGLHGVGGHHDHASALWVAIGDFGIFHGEQEKDGHRQRDKNPASLPT
jgi:hypothetical protein